MKYKNIFKDVVFVSQLTGVDKKKIRILLSVILANLTVFFDILVIEMDYRNKVFNIFIVVKIF